MYSKYVVLYSYNIYQFYALEFYECIFAIVKKKKKKSNVTARKFMGHCLVNLHT